MKYHYTANELHAVWDTVIYDNHKSIHRPFDTESGDSWDGFKTMTEAFMSGVEVTESEYSTLDFAKFRDESSAIAQTVYDDIKEGKEEVVPADYIAKWEPIAKKRVATAAYRMAYMIGELFGDAKEEVQEPEQTQEEIKVPE